jgi:hypothetical protein
MYFAVLLNKSIVFSLPISQLQDMCFAMLLNKYNVSSITVTAGELKTDWSFDVNFSAPGYATNLRLVTLNLSGTRCIAGSCIGYIRLPQSQKQCIYVK